MEDIVSGDTVWIASYLACAYATRWALTAVLP